MNKAYRKTKLFGLFTKLLSSRIQLTHSLLIHVKKFQYKCRTFTDVTLTLMVNHSSKFGEKYFSSGMPVWKMWKVPMTHAHETRRKLHYT